MGFSEEVELDPGMGWTLFSLLPFCQTPGKVFRLGVDFVLPLSQEEEEEKQEEEPLTKIYQKGEY